LIKLEFFFPTVNRKTRPIPKTFVHIMYTTNRERTTRSANSSHTTANTATNQPTFSCRTPT